ncbi:MAG: hypothetical protein HY646_10790 [Acidobacteria bacterium]|nr:hypothetical protein [Acidobacteriota bacterium]
MFGLKGRQVFFLLVLLAAGWAGFQYIPSYYAAVQLNDYARQEVKFAISARRSPTNVRDRVMKKAEELGVELDPEYITITRRGPSFTLDMEYSFPINLLVYHHDLLFSVSETGEVYDAPRR